MNRLIADLTHLPSPISDEASQRLAQGRGAARNPAGVEISLDSRSLLRGGKPWMPVMGEMQYSRCAQSLWRDGLLKMKAGGVDVVATYVFWIHHEEIEGAFDFSGRRSLREFALLCQELGLYLWPRCGPWVHGECRNGGFPDWLLQQGYFAFVPEESKNRDGIANAPREGFALRSDDPGYLAKVRAFYRQIARQLGGLFWKEGGPVIGVQLENEYEGPAEHLLTLKKIARESGLDAPFYAVTGWPGTSTPIPFGELLPLYGGYAEGFWDRNTEAMPGAYWEGFAFKPRRVDANIATDHFGRRETAEDRDEGAYPYLTCEIGGGMPVSYHRRVRLSSADVVVSALVKLGEGNSLPGYYIYHGGTNPDAQLSTLNESQETGYPNDLPAKTYDFDAPLGEFGQVREHYHALRRLNLFIRDYGELMAAMSPVFPTDTPAGKHDTETLRWCVRSDGRGAFLFVNNYQRLQPMPPKRDVQFTLRFKTGDIILPGDPVTLAADSYFVWPINIDLGGISLIYATAELLWKLDDGDTRYVFFAETAGVPAEFVFDKPVEPVASAGKITRKGERVHVGLIRPGLDAAIRLQAAGGRKICIVLLDGKTSLSGWKVMLGQREHIVLTPSNVLVEGNRLRCQTDRGEEASLALLPAPPHVTIRGHLTEGKSDGVFTRYSLPGSDSPPLAVKVEQIRNAEPARPVPIGPTGVAEAPSDAEFERAAVWRIKLPVQPGASREILLRFNYLGDAARIYHNGRLLTDNFYHGTPFEFGIKPYAPGIYDGELLLKVLPLRQDAPVYLLPEAWPTRPTPEGTAELRETQIVETSEVEAIVS
ncbi:MAG: beta-galactosidase [Terrimicrobiaceae bacterium]